ncbi:MAG: COG2426 family protein [Christensenellales bacterium]
MEIIKTFFAENFQNIVWLAVFLIALLPFFEGRVALSFALNNTILNGKTMSPLLAILTCFLSGIFLSIFLIFFFNLIVKSLKKYRFFNKIFNVINLKIEEKSANFKRHKNIYFYLFLFVLIPLPLTGIYTASLVSCFLNLSPKKSLISLSLGNLCCLILVYIFSLFFKDFTIIIFIALIIVFLILLVFKKRKKGYAYITFIND